MDIVISKRKGGAFLKTFWMEGQHCKSQGRFNQPQGSLGPKSKKLPTKTGLRARLPGWLARIMAFNKKTDAESSSASVFSFGFENRVLFNVSTQHRTGIRLTGGCRQTSQLVRHRHRIQNLDSDSWFPCWLGRFRSKRRLPEHRCEARCRG